MLQTTSIDSFELAAIDVGSNAARLLINHVDAGLDGEIKVRKSFFVRVPLRLGMDVFDSGKLSKTRSEEFLRTMKAYKQLMKVYHVRQYRACATSAMRDAQNGKEMLKQIEKETGLKLEIISGDVESQIVYDNHLSLMSGEGSFLYVDVGGGSTEVTFMNKGERLHGCSYNIGTIRLLNGKVKPETFVNMLDELKRVTEGYQDITIIGSGGNINKLYRLASKRDKLVDRLPVETLRRQHARLAKMSVEERMEVFNLKPDRADVIVPAAEIFLGIADSVGAKNIMVPNLGLADGIINEMLEDYKKNTAAEKAAKAEANRNKG
jgi:exopolyphosphatase/guanosine-5'-triphosphate,3'-diphosphate pyrophosphatase